MLKPFWMLEGKINKIKRLDTNEYIEIWYEDENGDRAIVITKK